MIIRVIIEVWTRLVAKSPASALAVAKPWRDSPFRLMRRLALFAFTNSALPADAAADLLIELPPGDLFLTNASVEAYRLILNRWNDFPPEKQERILRRICEGPPRDWFREGSTIDLYIDRARFDLLSEMVQSASISASKRWIYCKTYVTAGHNGSQSVRASGVPHLARKRHSQVGW